VIEEKGDYTRKSDVKKASFNLVNPYQEQISIVFHFFSLDICFFLLSRNTYSFMYKLSIWAKTLQLSNLKAFTIIHCSVHKLPFIIIT